MVLRVHRSAGWQAHFSTSTSSAGRNPNFNTKNQTSVSRLLPWERPRGGGRSRSRSQHGHLASRSHPALLGGSESPRDSGCLERQVLKPVETGREAPSHPALCSGSRGGVGGRHPAPSCPGGGACGCRGGREAGRLPSPDDRPCPSPRPSRVPHLRAARARRAAGPHALGGGHEGRAPACKSTLPLLSPVTPRASLPARVYPPPSAARQPGLLGSGWPFVSEFVLKMGVSEAGTGETALWILQ